MGNPTKEEIEAAGRQAENSPVVWFAVLLRARRMNDFEQAAQAQKVLAALGIQVSFRRPKRGAK